MWEGNRKIVEKISEEGLEKSFSFGLESGIYETDITLRLSAGRLLTGEEVIRFTTDGSLPKKDSMRYEEPLTFESSEGIQAVTVRAAIFREEEMTGGPYTATYFLVSTAEVFQDTLLVSIMAEDEDLFSEERGILYPMQSFVRADTPEKWSALHAQNFAQEGEGWERKAYVDIFEGNGRHVISQNCGLSVAGKHGSITHYPFSLKLKADDIWEEGKNEFAYDFFEEHKDIRVLPRYYSSLSLKNGGNDYNYGDLRDDVKGTLLRNALGCRMAEEIGLVASGGQRVAIVYLNGEFYNLAWMSANLNSKALAVKTDLENDYFVERKYPEKECMKESGLKKLYHSFPDMAASDIFTRQEEFERKVDVDELFRYYAFELISGNSDWPTNNYAMWRYLGNYKEENPYSDGRYRHWVFDMDCIYGLQDWPGDPWHRLLGETTTENCLLAVLMQVDDYRQQFVNTVFDELNSETFSEEHILQMIEEEDNKISMWYAFFYGPEAEEERQENIELLKKNVLARRQQIYDNLEIYFGADSLYKLELSRDAGAPMGTVLLNGREILTESDCFAGMYDGGYPVTLQFMPDLLWELDCWMVNGKRMEGEELTLDGTLAADGQIVVQAVTKRREGNAIETILQEKAG